jgi:excisionase family DNA binding protein
MEHTNYDNLPLVMTVDDVMKILGIGKNTAYELLREGQIGSVRVGRQLRIPRSALVSFLESATNKAS